MPKSWHIFLFKQNFRFQLELVVWGGGGDGEDGRNREGLRVHLIVWSEKLMMCVLLSS